MFEAHAKGYYIALLPSGNPSLVNVTMLIYSDGTRCPVCTFIKPGSVNTDIRSERFKLLKLDYSSHVLSDADYSEAFVINNLDKYIIDATDPENLKNEALGDLGTPVMELLMGTANSSSVTSTAKVFKIDDSVENTEPQFKLLKLYLERLRAEPGYNPNVGTYMASSGDIYIWGGSTMAMTMLDIHKASFPIIINDFPKYIVSGIGRAVAWNIAWYSSRYEINCKSGSTILTEDAAIRDAQLATTMMNVLQGLKSTTDMVEAIEAAAKGIDDAGYGLYLKKFLVMKLLRELIFTRQQFSI